jgi:transcriptional regulator with XRE-family HTH domain
MDRTALADFLRRRREGLRPADVGLVAGARRRTPDLRRDEVALLANMSTDYYERLEQGRGPHPSPSLLAGVARALRLTTDERDHLYVLAGQTPPAAFDSYGYVDPGLMCVLDALAPTTPALVSDDLGTLLAQNPLNVALIGPYAGQPGREASALWRWFTDPHCRARYAPTEHDELGRGYVADLRTAVARRGPDRTAAALVADLSTASPEFRDIWDRHEVAVLRTTLKTLVHPEAGELQMQCDVVLSPPSGQRLVMFRPQPGTGTADRLDMLRATPDIKESGPSTQPRHTDINENAATSREGPVSLKLGARRDRCGGGTGRVRHVPAPPCTREPGVVSPAPRRPRSP